PVISPLGCDGEGSTYRLNSDAVAVEVARALRAIKLIYLTAAEGVRRGGSLVRQLSVEEAEDILKSKRAELAPSAASKLEQAIRAARGGVPRVHIIDGRLDEGLLAEVFSNQGIGLKLMQYVETQARAGDAKELFCLSTQAFNYFVQKGGYRIGTIEDLPLSRRERYERSGRRSQVLIKRF